MSVQARSLITLLGLIAGGGCFGSSAAPSEGITQAPGRGGRVGSGITIEGEQLWGHGEDLVNAMRSRVSGMQVKRSTSNCPQITLRGQKTILGPSDPHVYVDGTQAVNTCILDMLSPTDIDRVEVYRMGVTSRPGYPAHPYGLILVFSRAADQ